MISCYQDISPYITRDGSAIRELIHPNHHGAGNQSLAEARVAPGCLTLLHRHEHSEEIYHIIAGQARMTMGSKEFSLAPGDSVRISPGTPHYLINVGSGELRVLCCCSPPYSHEDTVLMNP
ncbi:MAG: cupin domain-containing protein [Thermodesulfobacteriota bacterium]|nr:cupin domain-containing protein [Thermodesulfobacteriota bacterium]